MSLLVGTGLALALATACAVGVVRRVRFARAIVRLELPRGVLSPGETALLPFAVHARSARLPAARVRLTLVSGIRRLSIELGLPAGAADGRSIRTPDVIRGLYRPATFVMRFADIFGLVETRIAGTVPTEGNGAVMRVLPYTRAVSTRFESRGLGALQRDSFLSHRRNDDHTEIRPYHPGDDMRRINWRMYAHTGDLFVRVGEEVPPPANAIRLLIDPRGLAHPEAIDVLVACALGMADELVRRDYAVTVSLHDIGDALRLLGDPARARYVLSGLDPERGLLPMSFGPSSRERTHGTRGGDDEYAEPSVPSVLPFSSARELIVASSLSPASPSRYGASAILAWYRTDVSTGEADVHHLGALD